MSQTVCLPTPSCFKTRMTTPSFNYIFRTTFKVELTSSAGVIVLASGESSGDWKSFCVAKCPAEGTAFDVDTGICKLCDQGVINEGGYCAGCDPGTYLVKGNGGVPARCAPCPSPNIWSLKAALSVSECFAVDQNLYLASSNPRIVAYDHDAESYSIVVADDGKLRKPADIEFITSNLFVLTDLIEADKFFIYDVDGSLKRIFTVSGLTSSNGMLRLPTASGIKLAVADYFNGQVRVVDLSELFDDDGTFIEQEETVELVSTFKTPRGGIPYPEYISLGETDDEVIVCTEFKSVYRACITSSCDVAARNGPILEKWSWYENADFTGIDSIPSEGVYLLSDFEASPKTVYRCDLRAASRSTSEEACSLFSQAITSPSAISVDTVHELVYIADYAEDTVLVFTYQGGDPIARLGKKGGDMKNTVAMSVRPGFYTPFSTFTPPRASDKLIAGNPITMPVFLHDTYNSNVTEASLFQASRFSVRAAGHAVLADGTTTSVTSDGSVVVGGDVESATLSSEIVLNIAGNWSISIMESGVAVPTHFRGSPFTISVFAAETDPTKCKASLPPSVTAGQTLHVDISTYDQFGNPTLYESSRFKGSVGGEEACKWSLV